MSRIDMLAVGLCMVFGYGLVTWLLSLKKPDPLLPSDSDAQESVPPSTTLSTTPWWTVLGVSKDASRLQIDEAYHAKLRQYALTSEDGVGSALVQLAEQQTRHIELAYLQALKVREDSLESDPGT